MSPEMGVEVVLDGTSPSTCLLLACFAEESYVNWESGGGRSKADGTSQEVHSKTRFLSEPAGKYNLVGDGCTSWLGTVRFVARLEFRQ